MNRRTLPLAFLLVSASPVFASAPATPTPNPLSNRIIVLDAGHGVVNFLGQVINPGKVNNRGQMEHKLNLEITSRIGALLEDQGARVFYTRTAFDYWRESYGTIEDNKNRAQLANDLKAEAYLSIHCDWNPSRRFRGVTVYYETPQSKRLGQLVHRAMIRELKAYNRKLINDNYTVLDVASMPAILVECGFLSNREETRKLGTTAYQKKIASAVTGALKTYFGEVAKKEAQP